MTNVLPLSIQPASKIEEIKQTDNPEQALMSVLNAFEQWRNTKKRIAEPIPDELCHQIFALEAYYSPIQLRRLFSLSTRQYHSKREHYFPNEIKKPATKAIKKNAAPSTPPKLCEIKIKPESPYALESLPSAKTLVVEFCRSDGQIMKIHTTQDSIPTLMHTFFGE